MCACVRLCVGKALRVEKSPKTPCHCSEFPLSPAISLLLSPSRWKKTQSSVCSSHLDISSLAPRFLVCSGEMLLRETTACCTFSFPFSLGR